MDDKVMELMKLIQLKEYVKENLNMEFIDDNVTSVEQEIEAWEKGIKDGKIPTECIEDNRQTIEELRKYIGYNCVYAIDTEGDFFGQGFVIINDKDNFNYIGFVRTI